MNRSLKEDSGKLSTIARAIAPRSPPQNIIKRYPGPTGSSFGNLSTKGSNPKMTNPRDTSMARITHKTRSQTNSNWGRLTCIPSNKNSKAFAVNASTLQNCSRYALTVLAIRKRPQVPRVNPTPSVAIMPLR
ncbi:MAG: hypothetical protein CMI01_03810 [Oceanospirillaceae bacterium]|nr:hypothetical protein [Oceanospirillaceae bacterium]